MEAFELYWANPVICRMPAYSVVVNLNALEDLLTRLIASGQTISINTLFFK
jgi:hypothetical protein